MPSASTMTATAPSPGASCAAANVRSPRMRSRACASAPTVKPALSRRIANRQTGTAMAVTPCSNSRCTARRPPALCQSTIACSPISIRSIADCCASPPAAPRAARFWAHPQRCSNSSSRPAADSVNSASVVLAARNNLYPLVQRRRWAVAFVFGLMHGFGFAAVLIDLGLAPASLALSLVAFNSGVELGQLTLVGLFLPLALWLRHSRVYLRWVFTAGSWTVAAVAGVWLMQRAFNLTLIPG